MKQKNYIVTAKNHGKILQMVAEIEADGKTMVTIGNATNKRHKAQNRLMHFWYKYISVMKKEDWALNEEQVKAFCKYTYGVPIMQRHEEFREAWEAIRYIDHEQLMKLLESLFPVTSLMSVKECAEYLTAMQVDMAEKGVILPTEDDLYYAAMGFKR